MAMMKICPKCGWFKTNLKCNYCNVDMIETDTSFEDSIGMPRKEKEALIQHYIDTLIKGTFDPEIQKWRIEQEKIAKSNFNKEYAEYRRVVDNSMVKCPSCGSNNTSKIRTLNRAFSVGLFGLASSKIGKTHKCNNCGTTW